MDILDGTSAALADVLSSIVGMGEGNILICDPLRLAFYEGEGAHDRYILDVNSTQRT